MATIKEKWIHPTYAMLVQSLAQDEIDKLDTISLSSDISSICQQQLDSCSDAFRYSFSSKGYNVDKRPHRIPPGYLVYVLNYARPYIASRFPNSKDIFIDEIREKLYDEAAAVLKDPSIGVPDPDYSDDPELSGDTAPDDVAITLPYQRYITRPLKYGFSHPYVYDTQLSCK